jgi:hypothetical protein
MDSIAQSSLTVQVVGALAAAGPDALAEHVRDLVEVLAGQVRERRGLCDEAEQVVLRPLLGGAFGHHVLGEDVQRPPGDGDGVQLAPPHAA